MNCSASIRLNFLRIKHAYLRKKESLKEQRISLFQSCIIYIFLKITRDKQKNKKDTNRKFTKRERKMTQVLLKYSY